MNNGAGMSDISGVDGRSSVGYSSGQVESGRVDSDSLIWQW